MRRHLKRSMHNSFHRAVSWTANFYVMIKLYYLRNRVLSVKSIQTDLNFILMNAFYFFFIFERLLPIHNVKVLAFNMFLMNSNGILFQNKCKSPWQKMFSVFRFQRLRSLCVQHFRPRPEWLAEFWGRSNKFSISISVPTFLEKDSMPMVLNYW